MAWKSIIWATDHRSWFDPRSWFDHESWFGPKTRGHLYQEFGLIYIEYHYLVDK